MSKQIAIFASGTGSNALKILEFLVTKTDVEVGLIVTNNKKAGVLHHAQKFNIPSLIITKAQAEDTAFIKNQLSKRNISFIALAGYLLKIPEELVATFPNKIVNIHPALLPKYGGKGMYGQRVHQAVIDNKEKESGITIHFVNENYDDGSIIAQYTCQVKDDDSAISLGQRVLKLEHKFYPQILYDCCLENSLG